MFQGETAKYSKLINDLEVFNLSSDEENDEESEVFTRPSSSPSIDVKSRLGSSVEPVEDIEPLLNNAH